MTRRVIIAGGGTGGHIFPGLAVADELAAMGVAVHWLGASRGLESELVGARGIPLTLVNMEGIHARGAAAAVRALAAMPAAVSHAVGTVLRLRPVSVLGVGGYASAAGVLAAGLLGIPWVLQEQNAVPGWTNTFLAPWSDLVCCGFADAVGAFASLNAQWTGNPVRHHFFDVGPVAPENPPRLLVLGGSQGSLFINRLVPRALALLARTGRTPRVVHQAGARWAEVVRTAYSDFHVEAEVKAFLSEPWAALAGADLVVARAGALTVAELAASGRPALLIPFAAAAGNHQEHNARSAEGAGGAVVLTEREASPERLARTLDQLLGDPNRLVRMGDGARKLALPQAARRIAERLLAVGGAP
ncbi:MAG: undecaprenyldiphospho-muramoylpentapeptide beta-N-acetylglucosaminyltransferase [Acidobacteria bacterium]|nr:undecaprenyldiphospho-muramoylpentapeptide beta-N-acetylglucosaminyltransferase [Acidobacteriota bacterium]